MTTVVVTSVATATRGRWRLISGMRGGMKWCDVMWCDLMWCDVGSVGIETSILPEGDTFFSFRLCMVIYPAKATNNPHGLRVRLTIGKHITSACMVWLSSTPTCKYVGMVWCVVLCDMEWAWMYLQSKLVPIGFKDFAYFLFDDEEPKSTSSQCPGNRMFLWWRRR